MTHPLVEPADSPSKPRFSKAFVVLNAKSGTCDILQSRNFIERTFSAAGIACEVHEPERFEDLTDRVREALRSGFDLIVGAGGDGTISAVAEGVIGTETPLGIIPLGTANVLARELGVPVDLELAVGLLAGPCEMVKIDAMKLGGRHYFTQVGVGIDALMIQGTKGEHKRRFGKLAYLWSAATQLLGFQPRRFRMTVDGARMERRASQVLVANCGMLGQPPFRWGPEIRPDDGKLDLCISRAETLAHYLHLGYHVLIGKHESNPNVKYAKIDRVVTIATKRPLPVQADGEIVERTPVTVELIRGAVKVVIPCSAKEGSASAS